MRTFADLTDLELQQWLDELEEYGKRIEAAIPYMSGAEIVDTIGRASVCRDLVIEIIAERRARRLARCPRWLRPAMRLADWVIHGVLVAAFDAMGPRP